MNIEITDNIKKANAITHSGCFHADELFCTVLLLFIWEKVILARVPVITEKLTSAIVYDIGGGVFDHHQPGGNGARENGIRYSSFGLMWRAYGIRILEEHYKCSTKDAELLFTMIDEELVQSIDCIDNAQLPLFRFPTKIKSLSSSLSDFYPSWNEVTPELENEKFLEAMQIAYYIFNNTVLRNISKLQARDFVEVAIQQSAYGILVLPKFMPWKDWILASDNLKSREINFVVFPSNRAGFTIITVPKSNSTKLKKLLLPENWAGLSGEKLQKESRVETALFCHPQRHIGAAKTLLGAVEMGILANTNYYSSRCS